MPLRQEPWRAQAALAAAVGLGLSDCLWRLTLAPRRLWRSVLVARAARLVPLVATVASGPAVATRLSGRRSISALAAVAAVMVVRTVLVLAAAVAAGEPALVVRLVVARAVSAVCRASRP